MTQARAIRCPRCGAFFTGEISHRASHIKCTYCDATLVIPKEELSRQQPIPKWHPIQPVVVYTRDEAWQIEEYGKLIEEMTLEEKEEVAEKLFREADERDLERLKEKRQKEGLTGEEERQLSLLERQLKSGSFSYLGPGLSTRNLSVEDERPLLGKPYLRIFGKISNDRTEMLHNCRLHVEGYEGEEKKIDTYIDLGTMGGKSEKSVDSKLHYSGRAITRWSVEPMWC